MVGHQFMTHPENFGPGCALCGEELSAPVHETPLVYVSHKTMQSQIDAAVLAEREACAKIADEIDFADCCDSVGAAESIAKAIRERSNK